MARQTASRTVRCYHCRDGFEVSGRAVSTSCPHCHKPVIVQDVIVKGLKTTGKLQTCGRVVIRSRGRVIAGLIEAQEGIEVLGALQGNVVSHGPVVLGPKARWSGDCRAPALEVQSGARIENGFFEVPYQHTASPTHKPSDG